eukprot:6493202-Prymnesium_polylepis.1
MKSVPPAVLSNACYLLCVPSPPASRASILVSCAAIVLCAAITVFCEATNSWISASWLTALLSAFESPCSVTGISTCSQRGANVSEFTA